VQAHAFDVKLNSFRNQTARVVQGIARGHAAGKVWNVGRPVVWRLFKNDSIPF
jgi:hypothetical protein